MTLPDQQTTRHGVVHPTPLPSVHPPYRLGVRKGFAAVGDHVPSVAGAGARVTGAVATAIAGTGPQVNGGGPTIIVIRNRVLCGRKRPE